MLSGFFWQGANAKAKLAKGELDAAITDYGEAIKLKPNYSPAYISRGYAFLVKGELDHAVAEFPDRRVKYREFSLD